jgi:ankyrin repeat protein
MKPLYNKTKGNAPLTNGPPFNLVVESSVMTPEEKQRGKSRKSGAVRSRDDGHNIARPETEEEFLALDFSSRCAVAGLQLGRTKVFLRREAFDRIEALRSERFFSAAATIQKIVRGRQCRYYYLVMRGATIMIQSIFRMRLASRRIGGMKLDQAATKIQSSWRMYDAKLSVWQIVVARKAAATMIQRTYRRRMLRAAEPSVSEEEIIRAITLVQAMHRGSVARKETLLMMERRDREEQEREEREEREREEREKAAAAAAAAAAQRALPSPSPVKERQILPVPVERETTTLAVGSDLQIELFRQIQEENWAAVEHILDKNPELAESPDPKSGELPLHMIARHSGAWTLLIDMVLVLYPKALIHRDRMGALPVHHASAHDNLAALEIIYSAYKEGINDTDRKGRLPIHVAAEFDAVDAVKFLLSKSPEGAYTMVYRPPNNSGGGLPLHIACRNYASIGVITALLAENFASAKRADENGDLPLHLLLRCGEVVDQVVVKTLLTCFSSAVSRTDMNGDLPLAIAIKHQCRSAVVNSILMQFPEGAGVLNGDGHSPLFLAFKHNADDRTIMGLLNHAPEVSDCIATTTNKTCTSNRLTA